MAGTGTTAGGGGLLRGVAGGSVRGPGSRLMVSGGALAMVLVPVPVRALALAMALVVVVLVVVDMVMEAGLAVQVEAVAAAQAATGPTSPLQNLGREAGMEIEVALSRRFVACML
ncbi:hypothetical protein Sjap_004559 [Stephania japonica]|uniref:Uncharacterized protein n=1 Tax=Stephania japonica TaxID=461633 RepID=A0AAP0PL10_9MAGN